MRHLAALSALAIVGSTLGTGLAGCKDSEGVDPPADATSQADGQADAKQADATIDAARDATPPPETVDTDPLHVAACESLASSCKGFTDPNCGKCQYRIRYKSKHCSKTKPCDNLFLLWSAGTCTGTTVAKALDQILDKNTDFVAACVAPQVPGQMLPVSLGAPERDAILIPHVLDRLRKSSDLGVWSGKNLLMGGCSAGASRYPVVAARYPDEAAWVGSVKTGAGFFLNSAHDERTRRTLKNRPPNSCWLLNFPLLCSPYFTNGS